MDMAYVILLIISFLKGLNNTETTGDEAITTSMESTGWWDSIWNGVTTATTHVASGFNEGAIEDAAKLSLFNQSGAFEGIGGDEGPISTFTDTLTDMLKNPWILAGVAFGVGYVVTN